MIINKKFLFVQQSISNTLPYLGVFIILFVYIGTAIFQTYLLAMRLEGNYLLACTVGIGVALTRMFIVFQSQMGMEQVGKRFDWGAIAGFVLTLYTVFECYHLDGDGVFVSVAGLIVAGYVVEVIYLSRLNQASRHFTFSDPKRVKELIRVRKLEQDFFNQMEEIQDEKLTLVPDEKTFSPS